MSIMEPEPSISVPPPTAQPHPLLSVFALRLLLLHCTSSHSSQSAAFACWNCIHGVLPLTTNKCLSGWGTVPMARSACYTIISPSPLHSCNAVVWSFKSNSYRGPEAYRSGRNSLKKLTEQEIWSPPLASIYNKTPHIHQMHARTHTHTQNIKSLNVLVSIDNYLNVVKYQPYKIENVQRTSNKNVLANTAQNKRYPNTVIQRESLKKGIFHLAKLQYKKNSRYY